jgi:type II secretory ATPase GspE/PulE/Tfp pilus assembly ATPase PilB-like protein
MFGKKKKPAPSSSQPASASQAKNAPALPNIEFKPMAPSSQLQQGVLISCRASPQYGHAVMVIAHAINTRADQILLDFSAQGSAVRYRVDGLWEKMPPMDRETGDGMLVVLKRLFMVNPGDRRSKQRGKLPTKYKTIDWVLQFTSEGVPSGERALIVIETKKPVLNTLTDLGMRDRMQEKYKELINGPGSFFIFSGPPGHGLPTLWRVGLESADRFVRDFHCVIEESAEEPEMINIANHKFNAAAGETPMSVLKGLLLKQPDALILPDLYNSEIAELLCDEIKTEKRYAITRINANSAIEALLRMLATHRSTARKLLQSTCGVINLRLIRRLCPDCRQPFQPTPQLLQKLGIPPGRVNVLFQPYIPPPPEQRVDANGKPIEIPICKKCGGRGYFGRAAIFELLEVNDDIRNVMLKTPSIDAVLPVARNSGFLTLQEEGILAVATGLTSLQELQRVLTS